MIDKPRTFCGDLSNLPEALLPLTQERRWVIWRWEGRERKGKIKWTKPPYQARYPGMAAKTNDPATWGAYIDAVAAVAAGNADGIGLALYESNIGAADLDHCRDPVTGVLARWAEDLNSEANGAYRETTPSGCGQRLLGLATGPEVHRKFTFDRKTGAGVELYRGAERYITISGLEIGHCAELPPFDDFIDTILARHNGPPGGLDFNDAGPQSSDYDNLIRNGAAEGERSESFQRVVWHRAGQGRTPDEIASELARHPNGIGRKYADRLHAEVHRSYDKWKSRQYAKATGNAAPAGSAWPQIYVCPGELPRVVNEAEDALLALGRGLYQRGDLVVRPILSKHKAAHDRQTQCWRLIPVSEPWLGETLAYAARFWKPDGRKKRFVVADAPRIVAETYLARTGSWRLPRLAAIATAPFLRADGSICSAPGYDAATGILLKTNGQAFPAIPDEPGLAEAERALEILDDLIGTFPFVSAADRAVALSAILTALDRRAMPAAPLHAITAPAAGTGKTLLVNLIALIATGELMPVISQGKDEDELEKRLSGELVEGAFLVAIDNCMRPLTGAFLDKVVTEQALKVRLLGQTGNVLTPVNCLVFATGNNLVVAADLTRRAVICSLDAQCERPELRRFDIDIFKQTRAERGRLVAAALTILRAWHVTRPQDVAVPYLGSFEEWAFRICGPLIWLGCADPCSTVEKTRENDPDREALVAVIAQWRAHLRIDTHYTVQQIVERAINITEFYKALCAVAARGAFVDNQRLGSWFKKIEGKIAGGWKIVRAGVTDGNRTWKLIPVTSSS
jgi:hypothetical protein